MNDLSTEGERTMTKYRVPLQTTAYAYVTVEADDPDAAIVAAREEAGEQ